MISGLFSNFQFPDKNDHFTGKKRKKIGRRKKKEREMRKVKDEVDTC